MYTRCKTYLPAEKGFAGSRVLLTSVLVGELAG